MNIHKNVNATSIPDQFPLLQCKEYLKTFHLINKGMYDRDG